jgi:MFS transporter, PAT family, beta-lactamase induction signal transducer AmpG
MFRSWRLAAVALQSFASGLPLGLVWIAIPTWMAQAGVDIKVVGLFTLAQAPWSFKFLWSPLMDRYPPPFMGRKRGWIFLAQSALFVLGLALAGVADRPEAVGVIGSLTLAMGLAAATQDIAIDAYAVEVLRREEQGAAVGARTALYRAAMFLSEGVAITLASGFSFDALGLHLGRWNGSWPRVHLLFALCWIPLLWVTWRSPEPEAVPEPPRTLRAAFWDPFVGFLGQHRALEILGFVVLYKLGDNLTQALTGPFLVQMGFGAADVGVGRSGMAIAATLLGTFIGGLLTDVVGLGRALWIGGIFQIVSNLGYAVVAQVGHDRAVMYAAVAFELGSTGLGSGAFGVLLLRLTQKRFSATQFALLSSLFSIPRVLAGPPAGLLADVLGWRDFYVFTVFTGIPGLVMLHRFVPWSVREPEFHVAAPARGEPLARGTLLARAALFASIAWGAGVTAMATLWGIRSYRAGQGFRFLDHVAEVAFPRGLGAWTALAGILVTGLVFGLMTAAALVARRGLRPSTVSESTE